MTKNITYQKKLNCLSILSYIEIFYLIRNVKKQGRIIIDIKYPGSRINMSYKFKFYPRVFVNNVIFWPIAAVEYLLYKAWPYYRTLKPVLRRFIAIVLVFSTLLSSLYFFSFLLPRTAAAAWPPARRV